VPKKAILLSFIVACCRLFPCAAAETRLVAIGAIVFDEPVTHLEMLELRVQPSKHVALGALLVHSSTTHVLDETQIRAHASFSVNPGRWSIESRHLVSHGKHTDQRYRHRLRFVRDGLLGKNGFSLRAYDEYFVDLNGRGSLRNMVTAGIGVTLGKSGIAEFYHAWSDERFTDDARYWLLVLSWRMK
jgi:hypothetical protein